MKNIWTDHAADDAKHDGSQPQEHKLRVGPALNIKLQNMEFQLYNYISYLLKDMFFGRSYLVSETEILPGRERCLSPRVILVQKAANKHG